jgi:hypothetical protein
MFNHFLITRFNLRKPDWKEDKNSQQVLDESWLKNRIQLFKNYCLPSVLGQTDKNFRWLIFFERDSEPEIKFLLEQLETYSFIEAILVNGYQEFQTGIPQFITERMIGDPEWIVTTRLDNDDAIHKDFIFQIQQSLINPVHNTIFHFPNGLFLDLGVQNRLASCFYPLNQFVSLVENLGKESLKTIFSREHDKWDEKYIIQALDLKDAWMQITHHQNMVNRFKGNLVFSFRLLNYKINSVPFKWNYNLVLFYIKLKQRLKTVYLNAFNN